MKKVMMVCILLLFALPAIAQENTKMLNTQILSMTVASKYFPGESGVNMVQPGGVLRGDDVYTGATFTEKGNIVTDSIYIWIEARARRDTTWAPVSTKAVAYWAEEPIQVSISEVSFYAIRINVINYHVLCADFNLLYESKFFFYLILHSFKS